MAKTNTSCHSIVHVHYACALASAYTFLAIPGAVPIANCSPGCVDQQFATMNTANGFQGTAGIGCSGIPGTSIGEKEIVFGGAKKLDEVITATLKVTKGDLYVVLSGCAPQLVGDDVDSVVKRFRERGVPIVHAAVPGFLGNNLTGHEVVVKSIIDQFVGESKARKRKTLINLWSPAPYFHTFWRDDLIELKRLLTRCGFEVNVFFGSESKGAEEWKSIPKAEESLRSAEFQYGVPLILGSAWEQDVAREKHALLLQIGTPVASEVVLHRTYIGYTGGLSLIEAIYSATVKL